MLNRVEQKEAKKQSLLSSAYALFTEKGVVKTSVDEIVRHANVAKGTFYLYFKDKGDLLQQLVYKISYKVLNEAYQSMQEQKSVDFTKNVLSMLDYVIEYFKKNRLVLRLIERNFSWPMVEKQLDSLTDPLWQKLVEALEASPLAQKYTQDEMFKIIYVIVEMCGSICYSSIIEEKPASIDHMKPVLYEIVRKTLQ